MLPDLFPHPDYLEGGAIKNDSANHFSDEPACRAGEFVTDLSGRPYQHWYYSPFGEELVGQKALLGDYDSPYHFNAKEVDPKTGLHYYGARYYNSNLSIWISVDPMASKGPNITPYAFSHNNPVMLVDPDGNWPNLATLSSWYTSVFNSAAKQTAQHRFNEMKDRTAAARGYSRNIRFASDQSFSVTGSSMRSKIQLADGRAFDQVKGSAGYNILGSKGTASFYAHRKNTLKLYDVTTIYWNDGKEGRGVSGGGMGGYGFEVTLMNSNNTVASMYLGEQEFNDLYENYYSAVDNQFNELLESMPMVKDYYNNVYGAESEMREFWGNTSDWTPEARNTYQQLTQEYEQALQGFNERWNP